MRDGVLNGLLDNIRAAPRDDAPRWVLADYFESRGEEERAQFVRLQLQHAEFERWDPRVVHNRAAQNALLAAHGKTWQAALPRADGVVWGRHQRGLVGKVAFDSVSAFVAHAADCCRAVPLTSIVLRWPRLEERTVLTPIEGLQEVTVVGTLLQPEDMQWLADSPLLSTIRALNLVDSQMELPALLYLLASPHLQQLTALRLPMHNFGNAGVEQLIAASLPNLVELDISVASQDDLGSGGRYLPTMDEDGAEAIAGWPGLARLHTLDLTGNQLGLDGLRAILSSPHAAGLETLRIRGTADHDWENDTGRPDVLSALAETAPGMALDELDISESDLTDVSGPALLGSPALASLKVLHFNFTHDDPFRHVVKAPWCESLQVLSANDCGEHSMRVILQRAMPRLHTLSLSSRYHWSRSKNIAALLAAAPVQPALQQLDLIHCRLKEDGLEQLGAVSSLPALIALRLGEAELNEEAVARFKVSALGARLESFDCEYPEISWAPEPAQVAVGRSRYRGPLRYL